MEAQTVNEIQTGNGLLVVRVDKRNAETWDALVDKHGGFEKTYTVSSPEFTDFYFNYNPSRLSVISSFQVADGVGLYADNGSVLATGTAGYELVCPAEIADVPEWMIVALNEPIHTFVPAGARKYGKGDIEAGENNYDNTIALLAKVRRDRADKYESWIEVGRVLYGVFGGSQIGLQVWDMWSRSSTKYESGGCAKKWGMAETYFEGTSEQAYNALESVS